MNKDLFNEKDWEEKRPWVGPQFAPWFASSRPQICWETADYINYFLKKHNITSIGVTGSLSPSVLISLAYGNDEREVNGFYSKGMWDEIDGWNYVIGDSPGMEKTHPFAEFNIPFNEQITVWDGASPFFHSEAIFSDLPFSHKCVRLDMKFLKDKPYKVIVLGFLEGYEGPQDVYEFYENNDEYEMRKESFSVSFSEKDIKLKYQVIVFEKK